MPEMRTYKGGCHCGRVRFEIDADLATVLDCNCSLCQKRGVVGAFSKGESEDGSVGYGINVRCLDDVRTLELTPYDGKTLL